MIPNWQYEFTSVSVDGKKPTTLTEAKSTGHLSVYCAACHQHNDLGYSQRFPPLAGSEWVTGDKKRLIEVLLNGLEGPIEVKGKSYNNAMPQRNFLTNKDIAEVLTHIGTNVGNTTDAVAASEVVGVRKSIEGPNFGKRMPAVKPKK